MPSQPITVITLEGSRNGYGIFKKCQLSGGGSSGLVSKVKLLCDTDEMFRPGPNDTELVKSQDRIPYINETAFGIWS